ncbi:DUF4402 domain-containing protein [Streptomyces scabiei]|uniref:DUF4402 domain-containing protein n=1 Tax=Streptomyces scabiei TaxID=1930 RepID=UPI001B341AC9|nr:MULTISPECIES: DUF4402 domain-containing protein [Streptomyces]MDX2685106.1 DUF4402 domain-containing protein [Streptomyces scabiei]MDX2753369.1 DUF4402 domain-containing protein [Streptomyces scabiei]MDX2807550.1 DUF4402 domain-containing protein [Streptomyces scabiei]MDX3127030.1 DUF4402 domain-containing protein [Streptomyces scabiei]MDX3300287.1 DUF4402 domain-containing protein [Streptomyces scabiei]
MAASSAYRVWSYKIEGANNEIPVGQRMTLALPGTVMVLDPSIFPSVEALAGTLVWRKAEADLQYVAARASAAGTVTIAFVAAAHTSNGQVRLFKSTPGNELVSVTFSVTSGGETGHSQLLVVPAPGAPVFTGRPLYDFTGSLPYDSELFGVYQPLAGWVGATSGMSAAAVHSQSPFGSLTTRERFRGADARTLTESALRALAERYMKAAGGAMSPVGLVNLFREYFFEFDTFLGSPSGHIWVSPGGTVEVVESSTRRTLVEKVAELSEEISRKTEESLTEQSDVSDAVKEDNASDTKLGVSATGGVQAKIYHADVSASFSTQNTVKRGSETTHKHTRTQTAKATSEIKRNFKTTFRTVTESTDTSSRRYVLQNTGTELVNFELRRKMRKVGVQLQHVGSRLCWQIHLPDPGRELGLGDMVHVVHAPDLTALQKPEVIPDPENKKIPFHFEIPFKLDKGSDDEAEETYLPNPGNPCRGLHENPDIIVSIEDDTIDFCFEEPLPTVPEGYKFSKIESLDKHGAQVEFAPLQVNTETNTVSLRLTYANFQGRKSLPFDAMLLFEPTTELKDKVKVLNDKAEADYKKEVERVQYEAYGEAVRERLRMVSAMRPRSSEDLRSEERRSVFRKLLRQLPKDHYPQDSEQPPYLEAEQIQQYFDVEEMLYFVAPDFWRPGPVTPITGETTGRYPVPSLPKEQPPPPPGTEPPLTLPLDGQTVAGWYSRADVYKTAISKPSPADNNEWRVNYLISEQTAPAPLGSSLGWLIQIDADERRNEFLNAAWAKAVLPIRPGQERAALAWLTEIEGEAGLGLNYTLREDDPQEYQGKTVGAVLELLAEHLQSLTKEQFATTLAAEKVFEHGFNPLEGGFRPAAPYQIFDQWVEVLPTDQIVAVNVKYDPKTGQQL